MTFSDPRLDRPGSPPDLPNNSQDVIPTSERSEDPLRTAIEHDLTLGESRPLTEDERKAADRDVPAGERVYAPASERVPAAPIEGYRDLVEHIDTHTPEREAIAPEPPFTRVPRPNTTETPAPGAYTRWDFSDDSSTADGPNRRNLMLGIGMFWFAVLGVGGWLFMRWRRERNKPINRLRRQARQTASVAATLASKQARQAADQARQAASDLRDRVPYVDEAGRPAMGLTTAVLSILAVLWQQSQARSKTRASVARDRASSAGRQADKLASRASEVVADSDWQKRLAKLKERWNPSRVELEKVSISRR